MLGPEPGGDDTDQPGVNPNPINARNDPKLELLRLENITFAYPGRGPVLDRLSLTLNQGERLGILGPIGAGKSTLFQVAMGLLKPQAGQVFIGERPCHNEKDFQELRRQVGYVFQDPDDQLFCPSVAEDLAFGPLNLGRSKHEALDLARGTLRDLGLAGFEDRLTYQLSGGEKRLVSLACVLTMRPRALLLDEPTTALDAEHIETMRNILLESEYAWAVVSHDREFLDSTCQRKLELKNGSLREI
jgi:cobalt/nickel transport system ATP-binding protein